MDTLYCLSAIPTFVIFLVAFLDDNVFRSKVTKCFDLKTGSTLKVMHLLPRSKFFSLRVGSH